MQSPVRELAGRERAKSELKALMPEDAKEAIGHGIRAKRSKAGAVSFDLLLSEAAATEVAHAPISESVAAAPSLWF
jgi:hypothetical protein